MDSPSPGAGQCVYQASNGDGYIIVNNIVYYVSPSWTLYNLGNIQCPLNNVCSMVDNGSQIIIAVGVPYAGNATGTVTFAVNPVAGSTVTLNGVVWTFIAGATSGTSIHIGASLGFTIATFLTAVQASVNPLITAGFYSAATVGGSVVFYVTSTTTGLLGTLYTLAASVAAVSGANLALGSVAPGLGYYLNLGTLTAGSVHQITDPVWVGADRVDYLDTFVVWNFPGTADFGSTLSNELFPLDPTYIASKTSWPDFLQSIIVNREQIFLPGSFKSELWYDSGSTQFPFARLPGTSIEHGIAAKYSIAGADLNVYFLSRDLQGQGIVLRLRANEAKRISNFALEYQLRQLYAAGITISDAIGYTYQVDGHLFYVLSFPSGNQTWVWDESMEDPELGWSQRAWTDTNGTLNRDRGVLGAALYGKNVVLDWQNGTLYEQSMTTHYDKVTISGSQQEYPVTYLRTFPHLMSGTDPASGQPALANGKMVMHNRFALDAECGNALPGLTPKFSLRWSDDRGHTWGQTVLQDAGVSGRYITRPDWRGLGQAMDRVYEVSWNFSGKVALNGAWVEGTVLGQ